MSGEVRGVVHTVLRVGCTHLGHVGRVNSADG